MINSIEIFTFVSEIKKFDVVLFAIICLQHLPFLT